MAQTIADLRAENERLRFEVETMGQEIDEHDALDEASEAETSAQIERLRTYAAGLNIRVSKLRSALVQVLTLTGSPASDAPDSPVTILTTTAALAAARDLLATPGPADVP